MTSLTEFELSPLPGNPPKSDVIWRGRRLPCAIDGVILEAQFQVSPGYLLLVTENSPFEDSLHIYLLNRAGGPLDALELCSLYASGTLTNLRRTTLDSFSFSFFGQEKWELTVGRTKRLPFLAPRTPVRAKSNFGAEAWLTLSTNHDRNG